MRTLEEAWEWYQATRESLRLVDVLASRYWDAIPWEDHPVGKDRRLVAVDAEPTRAKAELGLRHLDDLAVVVLFSVFESVVRGHLISALEPDASRLATPILREAAEDAIKGVAEGSFYRRVLAPLKDQNVVSSDLVTQVDQIRDYRNWVAHGRRNAPDNMTTPKDAYDRLGAFLKALGIGSEVEPHR